MAYVKLFKGVQDSPIGYVTINQLSDNAAETRAQMFVEHGIDDPNAFNPNRPGGLVSHPIDYHTLGHHDLVEIPRAVAQTLVFSQFAGFGTFSSGLAWTGPGIAACYWMSTGVFFCPVVGLSTFWGEATSLVAAGAIPMQPRVRTVVSSGINGNTTGLQVSTYKLSAGDFIPDDQAFTLTLYGQP